MATEVQTKYDVGGVLLDRPFKIRRLGHFGFNVDNIEACRHFYVDLLGFKVSDEAGMGARLDQETRARIGDTRGFFTRHNTDHHTFVLFNRKVMSALAAGRPRRREDITINQITWQVGSLAEVGAAGPWLQNNGVELQRTGRDMPGSNWHTYVYDPDGHTNEIYYGIEQVGWEGFSKPRSMYDRGFREPPPLPQINEFQEVQDALARGVDLHEGFRHVDDLPATYDVQGVLLPRPFKITRIGPVGLFVNDLEAAESFYRDQLGFTVTEETHLRGHRGVFLRGNTEHHCVSLFPAGLREELGFSPHTTSLSFGLQLGSYRQLRDAVDFLRENGVRVETDLPPELYPGIDYAAHAFDPDGHCLQLYYYMEQVGWDGRPRPKELRRPRAQGAWPEAVEAMSDSFHGEPFLGPWG
jgi:catechol 2,3-dioxygenase-like lactoylglutathione lyase family enzyme